MTSIFEFIAQLNRKDIKLWLDGERLRINAPEGTLSPALIAQLKKRKSEIMAFLRQHESTSLVTTIQPVARTQPLPLSFAQQRLWFLAQLDGASDAYNIPAALHLEGPLDVVAFTECWQIICERHEALRTTFPIVDSVARQQINPPSFELDLIDLSDLPSDQKEAEVARLSRQEAQRRFDLINGPLWRVSLLRLEEESHVLLVTMHHIISDGWSIGVLVRELSALYLAHTAYRSIYKAPLPTLQIQYADFAVWQHEWLQGERLQTQLAYWKAQLADAPPLLSLPTDHARPAQQSYRGDELSFTLPKSLHAKLLHLSNQSDATLFMTLQAAFAVLLWRYSGQEDILIGTPIANRQVAEVEHLIGFFVNTLVLRNDLSGNPSFRDFLASVRQTTLDAYQHQALPFELLVETLQPERSLAHSPLFQVMFILQNNREQTLSFSGLTVTPLEVEYPTAKFDLTLAMEEREEGLSASWEYNSDLFERATIERMAGHFQVLLEGIVANPDQDIAHLPLLSERERYQLLVEWNNTAADYPSEMCIHQLFEQQAERTPEAIAVILPSTIGPKGTLEQGEVEQLTYRELNARANQLAHHLIAQGVGPDVLVGIYVERSIEMIVGLLGILKAGGAYVPLDPSYPGERLQFMLQDAQVKVLLTKNEQIATLAEQKVIDLDNLPATASSNPKSQVGADNLAYVLYTSGSTGQPKGVAMPHRALCNLIHWQRQESSVRGRTLQFSPMSFDVSLQEVFATLCVGGTLVLIREEVRRDPFELLAYLKEQAINRLFLPFIALQQLADVAKGEMPATLTEVITAGEQLQVTSAIADWFRDSQSVLYNQYGPTESHVVSAYRLADDVQHWSSLPPIGRPIANTPLYILDKHLQPVPPGVAGELYIGGVNVACGYLNRPELTRQKFIPNPFREDTENGTPKGEQSRVGEWESRREATIQWQSARLYKTGDLCRYLPDGNIEFLGRADYQVKVRGFRIELGEIEAALNSQVGVQEAVVVVRSGTSGKQLVAYVVPIGHDITEDNTDGEVTRWRANLAKTLPDYMIPAWFVRLKAMPLSPNGKIDRRALPEPEIIELNFAQRVLPRTPKEEILVAIWQEVLGVKVGIHDNFFELGGHSLLATQVVSRIRQSLQVELPLRDLFSAPTIAELAKQLHSNEQLLPPLMPLDDIERAQPLPLSFAQQRLWFLAQLEGTNEAYNLPAALRLDGALDLVAFRATWKVICERHETLRTTFPTVDGKAYQQIHAPSVNPQARSGHRLEIIDLLDLPSHDQETEVMRLAYEENTRPFDLINGPLWRVTLLRLEEESHVLLVTMHHIISDGWSIGVLIREFSALYGQKGVELPELRVQYADFSVWQRDWLQGELLEAQLAYWKAQLADAPPLLNLPTDYVRPALQSNRGDRISFALSEALTNELTRLSQTYSTTLFMTLQAAFAVLLSRYAGQEDILIGTPIANRQVAEVEDLIGFFVNTLVLRNDLSGKPTFADFLARVRQTALDAYQHQALPFELLVETLQPERSLAHSPLFQVMFILQNNRQEVLSFSDITVSPIDVDYPIAKFDLTLGIEPHQEGLTAWWEYNTDLFERGTIERMAENFHTLLEGIVANPDQPIAQLPLLSERERYQLLVEWNDTGMPARSTHMPAGSTQSPCHLGIHQLFEQQVARTPEAIAVILPSTIGGEQEEVEQLTYRELNARANQLAHTLMAQGVGPNVLVGLCVERSLEMVVGLLGILKAGGAYVPLDPAYPQGRLAFILKDAQPAVLVTQAAIEANLPAHTVPVVCLDRDWHVISQASLTSPISHTQPDQIAYVIYTSGSTGEPKGVLISHRSLLNHSDAMIAEYEVTAQDRVLQFASISFDVAAEELFPSWLSGATVLLRPGHIALSFAELAKFVDHHHLTLLNLPASYWHEWVLALSEGSSYVPCSLRLLVVGSEKVEHERLMRWQQLVDRPIGWRNAYGPTEATITATLYNPAQREDESDDSNSIPIGRPIANTELYILDQALQPVPIGVPGELHIGGLGLALGYLNRPELTKAKFIEHPFSHEAGARLYKTGDLCRYRPNGDIEFIGRIDHQVKIHGFRIELGEIESSLMQIESISEAMVCPEQNNPSSLLAYLVLNNSLTVSGRRYQVHTALSNPQLQKQMEQVHLHVWPRFFMGDAVNVQYWPHLYDTFPAYQSAIIDAGEVVAACNAIPLHWNGQQESLPTGWDDAVLRGFEGHKKGVLANTLCILVGSIRQSHQSQGLSYELIKIMKSLAYSIEGIQYVIAPVRPTHKRRYPDMTLEQYCEQKREDGLSLDPWVRVHERLGGTILAFCHQSQFVEGPISEWELWTGQTISQSGKYLFEGCMQPVTIDIEQNSGQYYDLAVWMSHTAEPYLSFNPADVTPKALRTKLAQSLPAYMIPSAFVSLDAMPLLPNGKIDRRALAERPVARGEANGRDSAQLVLPRTPKEEILAVIWQEVLGVKVGIHDNFFSIGGHSLLATQVVSRIRQSLQVELPLRDLFSAPTIAQLAKQLRSSEQLLLPLMPLDHHERTQPLPLSFAQQRLWFLAQLEGTSEAYNLPAALRLDGPLDLVAFRATWKVICERHETLRTTFPTVDGKAYQQINAPSVSLEIIDLLDLPSHDQETEVMRLAYEENTRPFDLINGPLWRVTLLRLEEESHVLLVTMHHIISDGWSIGVLIREFSALYGQKGVELPELRVQYADFAVWQRDWLQGELLEAQLAYWKAQLADAPPLLSLPTDYVRPALQSNRGDRISFALSEALTNELTRLSQTHSTTLFMTLQAAFAVLLSRYAGQEDILIGTPIANRQVAEVEDLIGFFVNTLVLRNDLSGNPTFVDFLASVRQTALDGYQHQALPFELLVERLQPERSLSHNPLFQVMFILQNNRQEALSFSDITVSPIDVDYPIAKFDLTLAMEEREEGLFASWEYNTDLFERATIERMAGHFQTLLEGIVANPDQSIARLPLLSDQEKHQLLVEWNQTSVPCPSDSCFHQLFEAQAARTPDAPAVLYHADHQSPLLTYRELNERANQLAHYLRALGVGGTEGTEAMVGVCMERCPETVISLLAIFKAGGVYIPLDPALPQERLAYMLTNSEALVVLSKSQYASHLLLGDHKAQVIYLDLEHDAISEQKKDNPVNLSTAQNLAYVIYTSGSTGLPKGAMVEQQGMVNHLYTKIIDLDLTSDDCIAETAPQSFDISIWQFLSALLVGGAVHIFDDETVRDPAQLLRQTESEKITILEVVPSLFRFMLDDLATSGASRPEFSSLRWLLLTGEALPPELCREWFTYYPHIPLMNAYGPTECSDDVTHHAIYAPPKANAITVPIGRAVPNMRLYILDHYLQPVPIGVPGQMYVGGIGVGRGYLNDPERTAKAFMDDPFVPGQDARFYKTGDLCRYLPESCGAGSGSIEFLGRTDYQVKIRGFRIELGEIESALKQCVGVRQAVVVVNEEGANKRLVAYIVGDVPSKAQLSERLPDYMIPSAFVYLDAMPLTPNGKINRRALPAPEIGGDSAQLVLPRTPKEEILVAIWQEVLGIKVGIHDNFFSIGGHSLLATQVVSRIRQSLQVELPLRDLFSAPTIAQLAKQLHSNEQLLPPLMPLDDIERAQPLPLSFAQQRLWFLAQLEGTSDAYHIPSALRLDGPLDLVAFRASWQAICERHEVLRTTFPTVEGQVRQQIRAPSVSLEIIDLSDWPSDQQEAEVLRLAQEEGMRAFDLINGPLWRVTLLRLEEESHVLLVTMHHIISDGWSIGVLIREFSALYGQKGVKLPELRVQYADFAVWQRDWLQGELLEAQLTYWKAQLADAPPLLTLPTDHARPAVQSYRGAHLSFMLPKTLHDELVSLSQKQGTTLFMTLQAAFALLLSRYSGQEDILIGTPIANRQVAEVEDLIGFFVNTLVLRNDLSGNPTLEDFLSSVRQTALDAYQHQALPFELLVETLQPERSLSHSPLFQVMFILQNNRQEALSFSDITVSPIDVAYPVAKFDLTLAMEEREEGLIVWWEYNTELFELGTIERMAGHFQTLLEGIVANPDQSIMQLPLLSERERYQLLVEWNDTGMPARVTRADSPGDKCIHQLFEQQVERTPEAIAVVAGSEQLTYRQLNARANQLAHHLIAQGVGPDVLVGICVERSIEMVVGVLGVLKAGGAYVPLDPSYPTERLEFMLDDANVKVLLTEEGLATTLPQQVPQLLLDQEGWYGPDHPNPVTPARSEQLAYCIYTSGSTGRPKGVMVEHRHVQALLSGFELIAPKNKKLIGTSVCPFSFDVSVWELFSILCFGGTLHILSLNILADSKQFASYLAAHQVTSLYIPPALLSDLVTELETLKNELHIDRMLVGVEPIKQGLLQRFRDLSDDLRIINGYGPTESTVCATFFNFKTALDVNRRTPIGKAVANYEVYLVDEYLQPVPIGVPGELHIGGAGVARGYLNRPELTSEMFIANPFGPGRLYKTGDLCRHLPDGNIEFLGRIDYQVKIRGFRIELGEIETLLNSQPSVREAVVVVHEDASGKRLVAYVVPYGHDIIEDGVVGEVKGLRAQLSQQLPDYMIPSAFVSLDAMPLLPNGKINRRALSSLGLADSDLFSSTAFIAPRSQTEQQLAHIWQEVLGVHSVGIQDSFFDLGGHSLLAVRLMAQIQQHFGVHLPLATLFESPTIEQLAIRLTDGQAKADWSVLVPIQPNGDKLPFFCVPGVGGNVIDFYDLARLMGAEQPFYGLQAVGLDGQTAPYSTIEAIAAHHINAIQKIQPQGPYLLGGHSFGGLVAFEMAQQLLEAGHEVANLIIFDMFVPSEESTLEEASWDDAKWLVVYAETIAHSIGQKTRLSYDYLLQLDAKAQLLCFKEELERFNLWPTGADLKQLRGLVQVLKTHSLIKYVPQGGIPTPITLFSAQERPAEQPESQKEQHDDPTYGWQPFAKGPVNVISVPGDHTTMMIRPHIEVLAKRLREVLHKTH